MNDDKPAQDLLHAIFGQHPPTSMAQTEDGTTSVAWRGRDLRSIQEHIQVEMMAEAEKLQHPDKESRLQVNDPEVPVCIGCGRVPDEINEYIYQGKVNECTPTEFVMEEEGTFNPTNGHFACDECYMAMGSPSSPRGWKAP